MQTLCLLVGNVYGLQLSFGLHFHINFFGTFFCCYQEGNFQHFYHSRSPLFLSYAVPFALSSTPDSYVLNILPSLFPSLCINLPSN